MKKLITILTIISLLVIGLTSCKSDIIEELQEEANGECMDYINLHDITHDSRHMFFLNAQEGWMIGNTSGELFQGNPMLLHTTDGGQNWSIVNNNIGIDVFNMYVTGSHFKFQFTSSTHGYMSIDLDEITNYYTVDGGVTWNTVPLPELNDDESIDLYGMGVTNTQMVFSALVSSNIGGVEPCYRLYYVSNTTHTITNYVTVVCGYDNYKFNSRDIHFLDNGVINMSATSQNPYTKYMAHSSDYGNSWTYTEVENLPYDHSYMEFVNDNVGYMAVESGAWSETVPFYKTTNGGATWVKKIVELEGGVGFFHFSFADENNGLAIRFLDNALYKTTNGGDTWERVSCFNDTQLAVDIHTSPQNIYYPNVDNGIILTKWMDVDASNDEDMYQNRVYFYKGE